MSKTSPSYIDSHVGHKLKMLRLKMGKSLNDIGDLLGVSFQQIQKYEKGTNKISSSNIYILSDTTEDPEFGERVFLRKLDTNTNTLTKYILPAGVSPFPSFESFTLNDSGIFHFISSSHSEV